MERQSHHELPNVTLPLSKNHTGANADSRRGRPQFRCRSGTAPPQVHCSSSPHHRCSAPFSTQKPSAVSRAERQAIRKAQSTNGEKRGRGQARATHLGGVCGVFIHVVVACAADGTFDSSACALGLQPRSYQSARRPATAHGRNGGEESVEAWGDLGRRRQFVELGSWEGVGRRVELTGMDKFFESGSMDQCRFGNSTNSKQTILPVCINNRQ